MSIENQLGAVSHEDWMRRALSVASKGMREDEVPIGAIVVYKGKIIGQGYNQCESLNDSTAHAEMLAITAASNTIGDWRLNDCSLYVTKEPCSMCAGCYDEDFGACGSKLDICGNPTFKTPSVIRGNVLGGDSLVLIQDYFFKKRKKKKDLEF